MARQKNFKIVLIVLIIVNTLVLTLGMSTKLFEEDEMEKIVAQLLDDVNRAYFEEDEEGLVRIYDLDIQYGQWAYEYALKKLVNMQKWSTKQGITYTDISSNYTFPKVSGSDTVYNLTVKAVDEYSYTYDKDPSKENTYSIAVYHYMRVEMKKDKWVITKDWFSDPMADNVAIDEGSVSEISEYIGSQEFEGYTPEGRRKDAVGYADKYDNATIGSNYNPQYRDYNSVGGDCANFTSQILHEGGGFEKNSVWNYQKGGSLAWIKAGELTHYMLNSGRGSRLAVGNYEKLYQNVYELQPGDIITYEEKGRIKHAATVTGYDSKGYPLVSCHNADRHRVPWDIGWNREGITFWFVRVHY